MTAKLYKLPDPPNDVRETLEHAISLAKDCQGCIVLLKYKAKRGHHVIVSDMTFAESAYLGAVLQARLLEAVDGG